MRYVMGIDGGGSGCRAALADDSGKILATAEGGPANLATDFDAACRTLLETAQRAAAPVLGTTDGMRMLRVGMGLAGTEASGAGPRLAGALPFQSIRIASDALTSTLGALGARMAPEAAEPGLPAGIVAALGTGSVYARIDALGQYRQIGGRGFMVGDEAGGAWMGRRAIALALRAADGIEPPTPFLRALIARFGSVGGTVDWTLSAKPAQYARLAPEIFAAQDPAAAQIIKEAAHEVDLAVSALQPPQAALPVTLIGGLAPALRPHLATHWQIRPPQGSALDGALALARGQFPPALAQSLAAQVLRD